MMIDRMNGMLRCIGNSLDNLMTAIKQLQRKVALIEADIKFLKSVSAKPRATLPLSDKDDEIVRSLIEKTKRGNGK